MQGGLHHAAGAGFESRSAPGAGSSADRATASVQPPLVASWSITRWPRGRSECSWEYMVAGAFESRGRGDACVGSAQVTSRIRSSDRPCARRD